jgi:hypothetical protein
LRTQKFTASRSNKPYAIAAVLRTCAGKIEITKPGDAKKIRVDWDLAGKKLLRRGDIIRADLQLEKSSAASMFAMKSVLDNSSLHTHPDGYLIFIDCFSFWFYGSQALRRGLRIFVIILSWYSTSLAGTYPPSGRPSTPPPGHASHPTTPVANSTTALVTDIMSRLPTAFY